MLFRSNGPIALNDEYSYSFELLDDDDPLLYGGDELSDDQLEAMGADKDPPAPENNNPDVDTNSRMILRATGFGPRGTTVTIARILMRDTIAAIPGMNINPAILVNGDIELDGNSLVVNGKKGNVHSNGDITVGGTTGPMGTGITGDVTATGDIDDSIDPGGLKAGGMPVMPVPEIIKYSAERPGSRPAANSRTRSSVGAVAEGPTSSDTRLNSR